MRINPTILILMLGSLCQSAIGHSEAVEFLPNSERREPSIDGILTWDAIAKVHHAKLNELDVGFEFYFQNKKSKEVQIKRAISTCGCTVAKLPKLPWVIKPAQKGSVPVTMDLRGKSGVITKTIQLITDQGIISLNARVAIGLVSGPSKKRSKEERAANLRAAAANRQAIFAGKCVECHVIPTIGKRGKQLYSTACGICHESKNRAAFVTDLRRLAKGKDKEYWQQWITDSKPNSLMPAFAKQHGGNLDNSQIRTLVAYLTRIFPRELKTRRAVAVKNKPVLK